MWSFLKAEYEYYLIVFIKVQLAVDLSSHEDITAKLAAQLVRLFPVKQHLQHHQNQNMPYSCRTMSPILLQTINIFIATYLLSSGMGRCALTRFLYLVHSKSPTCTLQGPVLQLGLGTSTHLYRGDQGGRQCPWSPSCRWIRIKLDFRTTVLISGGQRKLWQLNILELY